MDQVVSRGVAMTPTLLGRWQTRLVLFLVIVSPVTLVASWLLGKSGGLSAEPFGLAAAMLLTGLVFEAIAQQLQRFRWDQDWPFALFVGQAVCEFWVAFVAIRLDFVPGLEACDLARIDRVSRQIACVDYALPIGPAMVQAAVIIALSLVFVTGVAPVLFPRWRYRGGQFSGFHRRD